VQVKDPNKPAKVYKGFDLIKGKGDKNKLGN